VGQINGGLDTIREHRYVGLGSNIGVRQGRSVEECTGNLGVDVISECPCVALD
jgi:hypothetical protein